MTATCPSKKADVQELHLSGSSPLKEQKIEIYSERKIDENAIIHPDQSCTRRAAERFPKRIKPEYQLTISKKGQFSQPSFRN
jgi:hypothetical protein